MTRIPLFERFSEPVPDLTPSSITRITEAADTETYDDDSGHPTLGTPGARTTDAAREGTRHTFSTETYDDDPGIGGLGTPSAGSHVGTDKTTSGDPETYDDAGHAGLSFPRNDESTISTRVDGETYDDDPGHHGLGTPQGRDTTIQTKVESETYDDDPGTWPVSLPGSAGR